MIVVFDAQCLLCSRWVKFLLKHDHHAQLRFASIQGTTGQALLEKAGLRIDGLQTLLVIDEGGVSQNTDAILKVLHALGWPWRAAGLVRVVPAPIRDALYRWMARSRYRLFGRSETCLMPPADFSVRFLD